MYQFLLFIILLFSISLALKTGTIFKLQCQVTGKVYIGRTTVEIEKAMVMNSKNYNQHKRGCYKTNNRLFEVIANKDYNVAILEIVYELANDTDFLRKLLKRQRYHIEQYDTAVNKVIPSRTVK